MQITVQVSSPTLKTDMKRLRQDFPNYWPDLSTNVNAEEDESGKEIFDTETKEKKLEQNMWSLTGGKKAIKNIIGTTMQVSRWSTDQIMVTFPECDNISRNPVFKRYVLTCLGVKSL